jgi:sugar phosphate isomerase/epimerase
MKLLVCCFSGWIVLAAASARAEQPDATDRAPESSVFARENLVAWCIVPFDAARRNPQQRAEMLIRLGISRLAYDWRSHHVPTFEDEIIQMQRHKIDFFAFWGSHPEFLAAMRKHEIRPQFWVMMHAPTEGTQEERVEEAARRLLPMVQQTEQLGCQLAIYNHGGWAGQPENMVAVARWLRAHHDAQHVGIVYNLHHGHEHIGRFAELLALMQPYLFCLNLNGMNDDEQPKILPVGQGQHDVALLKIIRDSGYSGPIGILDHRGDVDAEEALRANLDGLMGVLEQLGDQSARSTYP